MTLSKDEQDLLLLSHKIVAELAKKGVQRRLISRATRGRPTQQQIVEGIYAELPQTISKARRRNKNALADLAFGVGVVSGLRVAGAI